MIFGNVFNNFGDEKTDRKAGLNNVCEKNVERILEKWDVNLWTGGAQVWNLLITPGKVFRRLVKACRVRRCKDPRILDLCTIWRCMVSLTLQLFYPRT
jgi:hypothetical protein